MQIRPTLIFGHLFSFGTMSHIFLFFFQAEDGIRDDLVTGVQTCALPISCIIASSREAKRLGIKTGDRTWESIPKCPSLILVSADFNKYYDISKKFLKICNSYSPYVEMFSLDEVFIDVTQSVHLFGSVQDLVFELKRKIAL